MNTVRRPNGRKKTAITHHINGRVYSQFAMVIVKYENYKPKF